MLGLRPGVRAGLFDLDGVLTDTAKIHAAAWKQMFDEFLRAHAAKQGEEFVPFDAGADYETYVDGKPRYAGAASFLAARGVQLPEGSPNDPHGAETLHGLGERKHDLFIAMIKDGGVEAYDGSVRYVRAIREEGSATAVVSSSSNCRDVLKAAGIEQLFDAVIDGIIAERDGLKGKPAPDTYLAGASAVGATPASAAVFEDALVGVEAGRAGGFAVVVGVDRVGQADALRAHGADVVVADLGELLQRS